MQHRIGSFECEVYNRAVRSLRLPVDCRQGNEATMVQPHLLYPHYSPLVALNHLLDRGRTEIVIL